MQKRYLRGWDIVKARVLDKLEEWVRNNGGEVLTTLEPMIVERPNGTQFESIHAHWCYSRFIYNGYEWYVQFDSNPFFPHWYQKFPVKGNSRKYYLDEFSRDWTYNNLYDESELDKIFEDYLKCLLEAEPSRKVGNRYEKRRIG